MNNKIKRILLGCLSVILILSVGIFGAGAGVVSAFAKNETIRTKESYKRN